jgi:hypothetical protein
MKMTKKWIYAVFTLMCALAAISLAACSGETEEENASLAEFATVIPTLDTIAGTWERDYSYEDTDEGIAVDCREFSRLVVAADGSYTMIQGVDETYPNGYAYYDYRAEKGTISASLDGVVTRTYSKTMRSSGSSSSAKITDVSDSASWSIASSAVTEAYPWRIIDGALATMVYVRSGTGTGIVGEWSEQDTKDDKGNMTFTDNRLFANDYHFDGTTWNPDGSWTFDYTIVDDHTLSITGEGEAPWILAVYLSGDVFVGNNPEERFVKK